MKNFQQNVEKYEFVSSNYCEYLSRATERCFVKISFEIFPPKTPSSGDELRRELKKMACLRPDFISVTCGAGGDGSRSTHETIDVVTDIGLNAVAHATCG